MTISGTHVWDIYRKLLGWLVVAPKVTARGNETRELLGVQLRLENAYANVLVHPIRNLNYRFMVAEWLWILYGFDTVETIARYNQKLREFSDDGKVFHGAYGPRWLEQFQYALAAIKTDQFTRRAVIDLWRKSPPLETRDVPCTLSAQFVIRHEQLTAIFTMRSSDVWLGVPYDIFNFSMLTNALQATLNARSIAELKRPPQLIMNLGSSHLYEKHYTAALGVIETDASGQTLSSAPLVGEPPTELLWALRDPGQFRFVPAEDVALGPWVPYLRVLKTEKIAEAYTILKEVSYKHAYSG